MNHQGRNLIDRAGATESSRASLLPSFVFRPASVAAAFVSVVRRLIGGCIVERGPADILDESTRPLAILRGALTIITISRNR